MLAPPEGGLASTGFNLSLFWSDLIPSIKFLKMPKNTQNAQSWPNFRGLEQSTEHTQIVFIDCSLFPDWLDGLIGLSELLLVVSHLLAFPVQFYGLGWSKISNWNLDVGNIFARSHTARSWRCSEYTQCGVWRNLIQLEDSLSNQIWLP
jgi:hypothetical protein